MIEGGVPKKHGCYWVGVYKDKDKDLLLLVQDEVRSLIKDYRTTGSQLNLQNRQVSKVDENAPFLKDQDKCKETKLDEQDEHHDELEEKLQEASENRYQYYNSF